MSSSELKAKGLPGVKAKFWNLPHSAQEEGIPLRPALVDDFDPGLKYDT
jgi:hypothetical protein